MADDKSVLVSRARGTYQPCFPLIAAESIPGALTHYVVVRADLPIGFLAAQVVHAAGESSPGGLSSGTNAVVLAAEDEAQLICLEEKLLAAGVAHVAVREPDEPWSGALTAIGFAPVATRASLRHFLHSLPLFGRQPRAVPPGDHERQGEQHRPTMHP